jgi:drug/metabolite transporter (DMT)-like permease
MSKPGRKNTKTNRQDEPPPASHSLAIKHLKFLLIGVLAATIWTLVGCFVAYLVSDLRGFLDEWRRVQVLPCLAFATWLLLLSRSPIFPGRIRRLVQPGHPVPRGLDDQRIRASIVVAVTLLAAAISIGMGFNAQGPTLLYLLGNGDPKRSDCRRGYGARRHS